MLNYPKYLLAHLVRKLGFSILIILCIVLAMAFTSIIWVADVASLGQPLLLLIPITACAIFISILITCVRFTGGQSVYYKMNFDRQEEYQGIFGDGLLQKEGYSPIKMLLVKRILVLLVKRGYIITKIISRGGGTIFIGADNGKHRAIEMLVSSDGKLQVLDYQGEKQVHKFYLHDPKVWKKLGKLL